MIVFPTINFNGEVRVAISATDDSGGVVIDTLIVDIQAINDVPIFAVVLQDTVVDEDEFLILPFWATDEDGDSLSYGIYSDTSAVSAEFFGTEIVIYLSENWNGITDIMIDVSDTESTISDTIQVLVSAVNDVPGSFNLISPHTETNVVDTDSISQTFIWETSIDIDGDNVSYKLNFTTNEWDTSIADIDTTLHRLNIEEFPRGIGIQWFVTAYDFDSSTVSLDTNVFQVHHIVGVEGDNKLPTEYALQQNFPNPFNPTTTMRYGLPEISDVRIVIYDIRGSEINSWKVYSQGAGWYDLTWDGLDWSGQSVSTGLYLTRLQAGSYSKVIKMLYLK